MSIQYKSPRKKGQVTVLMTFAIVPMLGLLGMVTDLGYMQYVKTSAQAAADSAVMAAIGRFHSDVNSSSPTCTDTGVSCKSSYQCPTSIATATDAVDVACMYAKQNGFTASGNQNVLVDSNVSSTPPSTAAGVNTAAYWISVRVVQKVPQLFSVVTGNTSGLVAARATGAVSPAKDCIYALDPSSDDSYYQNGSTSVTSNCGLYVNSNSSLAMANSGNSSLSATEYDVVGNYSWHGTLTPTPNTGAPTMPDPLKAVAVPSPCSSSGGCASAGCPNNASIQSVSGTVSPGTYCGGIKVKNATATFSAGTYILVGGGLQAQANGIIRGTGVMFYNTYDAHNAYTGMGQQANSDVQLSAPTSGTYTGILFFGDRNYSGSTPTETMQGGPAAKYEGAMYFPKSVISFAGNPTMTTARYSFLIGWRISVIGNSTVNNDYSGLTGGSPIQQVGLIE